MDGASGCCRLPKIKIYRSKARMAWRSFCSRFKTTLMQMKKQRILSRFCVNAIGRKRYIYILLFVMAIPVRFFSPAYFYKTQFTAYSRRHGPVGGDQYDITKMPEQQRKKYDLGTIRDDSNGVDGLDGSDGSDNSGDSINSDDLKDPDQ